MIDPEYTVLPVCNWYFMVASTVLITVIGTLVTDRLVEPRLGPWGPVETGTIEDIGENERRGMGWAGITVLVYAAVMALLTVCPEDCCGIPKPIHSSIPHLWTASSSL